MVGVVEVLGGVFDGRGEAVQARLQLFELPGQLSDPVFEACELGIDRGDVAGHGVYRAGNVLDVASDSGDLDAYWWKFAGDVVQWCRDLLDAQVELSDVGEQRRELGAQGAFEAGKAAGRLGNGGQILGTPEGQPEGTGPGSNSSSG